MRIQSDNYRIEIYSRENNRKPFIDWLSRLFDEKSYTKILGRLDLLQLGNLGNYKSLKNGLFELKLYFGPGYRIYFAFIEIDKVLILYAGTKATQRKDIEKAQEFYHDYKNRGKKNG